VEAQRAIMQLDKKLDGLLEEFRSAKTPEEKAEVKAEIAEVKEERDELPAPERRETKPKQDKGKSKSGVGILGAWK
jgi:hypothetical protein